MLFKVGAQKRRAGGVGGSLAAFHPVCWRFLFFSPAGRESSQCRNKTSSRSHLHTKERPNNHSGEQSFPKRLLDSHSKATYRLIFLVFFKYLWAISVHWFVSTRGFPSPSSRSAAPRRRFSFERRRTKMCVCQMPFESGANDLLAFQQSCMSFFLGAEPS